MIEHNDTELPLHPTGRRFWMGYLLLLCVAIFYFSATREHKPPTSSLRSESAGVCAVPNVAAK